MGEGRPARGLVDVMLEVQRTAMPWSVMSRRLPGEPLFVSFDDGDEGRRGLLILTLAGFHSVDDPSALLIYLLYGYQDSGCSHR
jgi:hypothetical protein